MSGDGPLTEPKDHDQYDKKEADSVIDRIREKYTQIQRQATRY